MNDKLSNNTLSPGQYSTDAGGWGSSGQTPGGPTPGGPSGYTPGGPDATPKNNLVGIGAQAGQITLEVCTLCLKDILLTDEYIKLWNCNHLYHRICMIHKVATATDKKFFLTEIELQGEKSDFHICHICWFTDYSLQFGKYRSEIIFDLLKEKG